MATKQPTARAARAQAKADRRRARAVEAGEPLDRLDRAFDYLRGGLSRAPQDLADRTRIQLAEQLIELGDRFNK